MGAWLSWSLVYLLSEWIIRLVMLPVVMRRRRPAVAMAWLLVIFFEPWVGLAVYLLIGENRLPRRRIREHERAMHEAPDAGRRAAPAAHVVQPPIDPEQRTIVTLAERLGEMPIVGGNSVELMRRTEDVIDRFIADVDAAEHHVHLLVYIYQDDATGRRVGEALTRAVERGVACRVLADGVGSWRALKTLLPELGARGVEVRPMLPVNPLRRRLARMDLRNHRKLAVVDGRIAYTGSQNVVDPTYGHKHLVWHDVMARMTGPIVRQAQNVFADDWYFETEQALGGERVFPEPEATGDVAIQTLPSGPTYPTENYQRLVVTALHASRRQVIITTPYLAPDEPLLQALQVAVMRGVDVRMIVPARSDQRLAHAAGRAYYQDLLEMGVRLYRHREGLLHAKIMTVDDAVGLIGSGNFDMRSFYLNFELNMLMYGPYVTAELRHVQRGYMSESAELTLDEWNRRSAGRKLIDNAAKLLSPLV